MFRSFLFLVMAACAVCGSQAFSVTPSNTKAMAATTSTSRLSMSTELGADEGTQ
eukprot:CAMPEP_0172439856 /NCGR_PEP_ID=MMETSP1065-20121228/713_1 /TAXON_ID=265537 /ORGANISM="Amphiprora paludosa, Strain CCMP125" /LENGTH=53 /DNA_ID=CAMNT_0013188605 /DNA_START=85 /DNA_END=243 /DNA_ORIENTATION=+